MSFKPHKTSLIQNPSFYLNSKLFFLKESPIHIVLNYSNNCKFIVKSVNNPVDLCYSEKDGKNPETWENDSLIV